MATKRSKTALGGTVAGAARLDKKFIGKGASTVTRIATRHPAAAKAKGGKLAVAKLARLNYLKIKNPAIQGGMIRFSVGQRPQLLSHPGGRQYYIAGGNQKLDGIPAMRRNPETITLPALRRAGVEELYAMGRFIPLGEVTEIGYFERKKVEDFRPTPYFHHFGEENGKRPILVYDSSNKQIHRVGGDYRTLWSGINN